MVLKNTTFKRKGKNIGDCFINKHTDFKYPHSVENFVDLLEFFQRKKADCGENYLGENTKLDRRLWTISRALLTDQKHLVIF